MTKEKVEADAQVQSPINIIFSPSKKTRKKHRICFSPAPTVHEFDTDSPTSRRMEVKFKKIENADETILFNELQARGLELSPNSKLNENNNCSKSKKRLSVRQKNVLRQHWIKELQEELESMGVNGVGDHLELAERIHLIDLLRRRAQIRIAYSNCTEITLPIDMSNKELVAEVNQRKIVVNQKSRKKMVEALELALVKENQPLIGDGYDFGRRLLSAADLIEAQDLNNNELKAALKIRGVKPPQKKNQRKRMLQKLLEEDLEKKLRRTLYEELQEEFRRRSIPLPFDHLHSYRNNPKTKGEADVADSIKTSPLGKRKRQQQQQLTNDKIRELFDSLYSSNQWKEEYPDVSPTEIKEESKSRCVSM
uniref:Uncharacterized protein n=1 Tax=Aplanochytrium stocchinoi TaxID=215587 RepID=A0A7S3LL21_9STRA